MRKYWLIAALLAAAAGIPAIAPAQQPATTAPPPRTAQVVPGFEQLRDYFFPKPAPPRTEKGAKALYLTTLELWKKEALVFMDMKTGKVDSSKASAWFDKWEKKKSEIKDDNDFDTADLLIRLALNDLGERFNYYLTPDEVEEENKTNDPTSVGIGAGVEIEGMMELVSKLKPDATDEDFEKALVVGPKHRVVLSPIKGSPSEAAGLKEGDILTKVDGEAINGMILRDVLKLVKGKAGSAIEFTVERKGKEDKIETVKVSIRRAAFTHPVVHTKWLAPNMVLIKLDHFSANNALVEFEQALREVVKYREEKKIDVMVLLDLRNNPGGRLDFAVNMVSYMLPEGNIVTLKERKGDELAVSRWTATRDALIYSYPAPANPANLVAVTAEKRMLILPEDVPLVVLVNHRSASASELTSKVLQYYKRAIVVGEPTYGKGVGQQVYELPDKRRGKVIKFVFCPGDQDIDWEGVIPNQGYLVKWQRPEKKGDDNQVEAAKKAALAELARIKAEREASQKAHDGAVKTNKDEWEKRKKMREDALQKQYEEKVKGKGAGDKGKTAQPVNPGQPGTLQPGTLPQPGNPADDAGKPKTDPNDRKSQPGTLPPPPPNPLAPDVMPRARDLRRQDAFWRRDG